MSSALASLILFSSFTLIAAFVALFFRRARKLAVLVGVISVLTAGLAVKTLFWFEEAQLQELRKGDPKAYLSKLKSDGDNRWEVEFQKLDSAGYTKFVAERQAREAEARRTEISELLKGLAVTPSLNLDALNRGYQRLNYLDPTNQEYKNKLDAVSKQMEAREQKNRLERDQADSPERYMKIENFSWSKGGFDTVMIANFSIRNTLPWSVKDVKIRCKHSAPSGTVIEENTQTIYEVVGAHQIKPLTNISMGFIHSQASRSGCEVIGVASLR
jgi:hypothetical protein